MTAEAELGEYNDKPRNTMEQGATKGSEGSRILPTASEKALPTAWFQISDLQNSERMNFSFKPY